MSTLVLAESNYTSSDVELLPSILPSGDSVVFESSSFFTRRHPTPSFPSPAKVLTEAIRQSPIPQRCTPLPVHFPSLGLTVKYGRNVSVSEGQCLWAIRKLLGGSVPVPEVYGWTTDDSGVYIYMEYIEGETLEAQWEHFSDEDKGSVCHQLRATVGQLRRLKQVPGDLFIGKQLNLLCF